MKTVRSMMCCAFALVSLSLAGCDGSSSPSGGTDAGFTSCTQTHMCSGTACQCTTSGRSGVSCCETDNCPDGASDSNNCEAVCRVCM